MSLAQFALLAQADSNWMKAVYFCGVVFFALILPFVLGRFLSRQLRMENYGWKIGLILVSVFLSIFIVGRTWESTEEGGRFKIKLGVDLQGGVILVYEVDENAPTLAEGEGDEQDEESTEDWLATRFSMPALVEALQRRINPSGTKEIVVRPVGEQQVEIIIPEVDQNEVERIKRQITTAGVLQFRIVANSRDHGDTINLARQMAESPDSLIKRRQVVRNERGAEVGFWARVAREVGEGDVRPFKLDVSGAVLRDSGTGALFEVPPQLQGGDPDTAPADLANFVAERGVVELDVLMATDDGYNITGGDLGAVTMGSDEVMRPCINFNLKGDGIDRFADLTYDNAPDGSFQRRLGIMLDNALLSAPSIREMIQGRGQISGRFTQEEVSELVNILRAGSLPVVLNKNPISENLIDPLLGKETIRQGKFAIIVSLVSVLIFISLYYRFSGLVACMALLANLLFIFAMMISINAALTLPGLAGLVLTVGMSVDANVLIFERIREELGRGAALRMAIRNGFGRATTTIVDANVTTLITAIVLYAIGTDQIRGFAVTLIFGILMSMYTAIFCSRVIFDIAERTRRITKLRMTQLLGATQIDFIGKRRLAAFASATLIIVGVVGIVARGADIFDIDFRGGTSVHMTFAGEIGTDEVRAKLRERFDKDKVRFTVTAMNNTAGTQLNNTFKVDSSLAEVSELQDAIQELFSDSAVRLATYSLEHGELKTQEIQAVESAGDSPEDAETATDSPGAEAGVESPEADDPETSSDVPEPKEQGSLWEGTGGTMIAMASGAQPPTSSSDDEQSPISDSPASDSPISDSPASDSPSEEDSAAAPVGAGADNQGTPSGDSADGSEQPLSPPSSRVEVELTFGHAINAETLQAQIVGTAADLNFPISKSDFELVNPNWDGESGNAYPAWTLRIPASEEQTAALLLALKKQFESTPVWQSSNKIGGQVADRMQNKAIAALLTSLLGIVVYIWIRFQRVIYGLAAVVALIHDVLITLGAIALSAWLTGALGFLLIEEFKISLPIVAALLTIIGYSLNDTIVVFDRIREVKGKSPELTSDMINKSINQTLNRTLLTSLTTLLVVLLLYSIGGQGIHGFAFSLVVGVIAGTYSSIFVASPALLWMTGTSSRPRTKSSAAA